MKFGSFREKQKNPKKEKGLLHQQSNKQKQK